MNKVEVTCRVKTYPESGDPHDCQFIKIHSHWNDSLKVQLEIEGRLFVVLGTNLKAAIDNAMNT